eukprot:TRINITY_DN25583_c0_g1_i1.p1 TRINITY_DN25583_c0_g1~~TRINITY_DN25583_c0_g1_i1.p1  ORF type:complete len:514 (-),score=123.32 TRINITY_DN25583_c0_g1_i1:90-1631(-)
MKTLSVILLLLGLVCFATAYTTVQIGATSRDVAFDGLLGQPTYTTSPTTSDPIRNPADLAYSSRGGLYVTDSSNQGGRVVYYGNTSVNTATYVVGAQNVNDTGALRPTGLGLYTANGQDMYLAIASGGTSYTKFYNITGNTPLSAGTDTVISVGTSVGGPTSFINGGSYLSIEVQQSNGATYFADSGNNRVVANPNNRTGFPIAIYGAGADGLASSCNSSQITCLTSPTAVAIDCNGGVWISVNGVNNVTLSSFGLLWFPAGSRVASALYLPNVTTDFPTLFGISFNSDCSRIAFSGNYRVYVGSLALPSILNPLGGSLPVISALTSLGISGGTVAPAASASSNSLYLVQNTAWDINNRNRLAIADAFNNRVVFINAANLTAPSSFLFPSFSSTASRSLNASMTASPSASATSATPSRSFGSSASTSPSLSATTSLSSTNTATVGMSMSASPMSMSNSGSITPSGPLPSFSTNPGNSFSSTPSASSSLSSVPFASTSTTTGAGSRMSSWINLF